MDGLGAPQCPRLQTVLNEKFKFPQLRQVQSPSLRGASFRNLFDPSEPRLSSLVEAIGRAQKKLERESEAECSREREREGEKERERHGERDNVSATKQKNVELFSSSCLITKLFPQFIPTLNCRLEFR